MCSKKDAIALVALFAVLVSVSVYAIVSQRIVTGNSLPAKVQKMNSAWCGDGPYFYIIDYAEGDKIIVHNHLYMVELRKQGDEWVTTCLANPEYPFHFYLQGSTYTAFQEDETGRYIAIYDAGDNGISEPIYVFDTELMKFKSYYTKNFPDDSRFAALGFAGSKDYTIPPETDRPYEYDSSSQCVTVYDENHDIRNVIKLSPKPSTGVYLLDENTLVYMYLKINTNNIMDSGNILGAWRICFVDIDTEKLQELQIQ